MGTTVTTNLGLIKPDINEDIKQALPTFAGWASQNATNCDKIDALFRKSTHTWTPTWTADSVNPTLGSGSLLEGKYIRLFPRMTIGFFRMNTGGAGFATGTGLYRLAIPTTVPSEFAALHNEIPVGTAFLRDANVVANTTILTVLYDITNNVFIFRRFDGDYWRASGPFVLEQGDQLSGYFMYPTADA